MIVASTAMSLIRHGSVHRGSAARTTMSPSFPTSSDPLIRSSNAAYAPLSVYIRSASRGLIRSPGPMSSPLRVCRLTAHAMPQSGLDGQTGSSGVHTGQSEWAHGASPRSIAVRAGTIRSARARPRKSWMCWSPQNHGWKRKKFGMMPSRFI